MERQNNINLFEPTTLQSLQLSNRVVMAPMTRCRAIGNVPNGLMAEYYGQRASAGLIITEGVSPSPNGLGYARIPGIYSTAQTEAWKQVTNAVHTKGSKVFMQLMHTGRISHSGNMPEGTKILTASAVKPASQMWTDSEGMKEVEMPAAMTAEELQSTINEFVTAAANAVVAGFDGIELHGANGYLLEQFLNPVSNIRTDNYGGSIENRARFVLEVTKAVVNKIGADKTGIRLSPYGIFNDMPAYDETFAMYDYLTKELNKLNIAYIHVIDAMAKATPEGQELRKTMRDNFNNTIILNGGYNAETANAVLAEGLGDLVSFGSQFVSNPDLPYRLQNNIALTTPKTDLFYTAGAEGFTDYAVAG